MNREKMRIAKKPPIFPIEQIICTYEEIFIFNVNRKKNTLLVIYSTLLGGIHKLPEQSRGKGEP